MEIASYQTTEAEVQGTDNDERTDNDEQQADGAQPVDNATLSAQLEAMQAMMQSLVVTVRTQDKRLEELKRKSSEAERDSVATQRSYC